MAGPVFAEETATAQRQNGVAELGEISQKLGISLTGTEMQAVVERALEIARRNKGMHPDIVQGLQVFLLETRPKEMMHLEIKALRKEGYAISPQIESTALDIVGDRYHVDRYLGARAYLYEKLVKQDQVLQRKLQTANAGVLSWFTPEYLGKELYKKFQENRPDLKLGGTVHWLVQAASGERAIAQYHPWTGDVYMKPEIALGNPNYWKAKLSHEHHHALEKLGNSYGNRNIYWGQGFDTSGEKQKEVVWFHEGLTDFFGERLASKNGCISLDTGYPFGVLTGFLLSEVVGEELLRDAYFSGRFSEVQVMVDRKLGGGTFEKFIQMETGGRRKGPLPVGTTISAYDSFGVAMGYDIGETSDALTILRAEASGDRSKVQTEIDRALGEGMYERLQKPAETDESDRIGMANFIYLHERIDAANRQAKKEGRRPIVDFSKLHNEELYRRAIKTLTR